MLVLEVLTLILKIKTQDNILLDYKIINMVCIYNVITLSPPPSLPTCASASQGMVGSTPRATTGFST